MRKADITTGIIVQAVSLLIMRTSWNMPGAEFGPGVGFMPFWLSVLMAVLSVLLIINAAVHLEGRIRNPFPGPAALLNVGLVVAGLTGYIALLESAGFAVSTVLFVAFLLGVVQKERWIKAGVISLLSTGGLYVVFHILLDVKLPENIFGF